MKGSRRFDDHDRPARDHGDIEDRGVNMHRHALDKGAGEKRPGQRNRAIRTAKANTCAVTTPARPNTEILMMLVATEITASVAITAAPSRPAAIRSAE